MTRFVNATHWHEVGQLKRENVELNPVEPVAASVAGAYRLQKNGHPHDGPRTPPVPAMMSAPEKAEVVTKVSSSPLSPSERSSESWASLRAPTTGGSDAKTNKDLSDRPGGSSQPSMEPSYYSGRTHQSCYQPERCQRPSCRQLAAWITDNLVLLSLMSRQRLPYPGQGGPSGRGLRCGFEAWRVLGVPPQDHRAFHQMWATDASYFRVVGWGY